ncbi:MAG: DUF6057 family protein [Bacteroidales bacterium]|jgi:hypothetical protein|nr:DUF6057 family protein [Bacteroidales bacterium]
MRSTLTIRKPAFAADRATMAAGCLLSCFVVWWYLTANRYQTLFYQEQTQMFLFSRDYFLQYLKTPGGIAGYAGAFLTQFFRFPAAGAGVYLLVFWWLCRSCRALFRRFAVFEASFFVPFVPALLLLPASAGLMFRLGDAIALAAALSGFPLLLKLTRARLYFLWLPPAVLLLYAVAGGNMMCCALLLPLHALRRGEGRGMRPLAVFAFMMLVPLACRRFPYTVDVETAYFACTPFLHPQGQAFFFGMAAWCAACILPPAGMLSAKARLPAKVTLTLNMALAAGVLWAALKSYRPDTERIIEMGCAAENGEWQRVIDLGKKTPPSPVKCFYVNLALQQSGQLLHRMFACDQIGTEGLLISAQDNFTCGVLGEFYFRLGLVNEARRYAFESMVGYSCYGEMNVRNVKRLLECALMSGDRRLADKYDALLRKTLFYRNCRETLRSLPEPAEPKNMLIAGVPELLEAILEKHPAHRMAFEYLMAYRMLEGEYEKAKECYRRHRAEMPYDALPEHIAELLTLYRYVSGAEEDFYLEYPVARDTREHFDLMDQLLHYGTDDPQIWQAMEERYGDTYWFYIQFPLVSLPKMQQNEKTIY